MGIEVQPLMTFTATAYEAIGAGEAVSFRSDGTVEQLVTDVSHFAGVAKYAAAAGEAVTVQWGLVNVSVNGTGSAGDALTAGADAGKLDSTSTATDPIVGYAFAAWTADDTVKAFIYPNFSRLAIA